MSADHDWYERDCYYCKQPPEKHPLPKPFPHRFAPTREAGGVVFLFIALFFGFQGAFIVGAAVSSHFDWEPLSTGWDIAALAVLAIIAAIVGGCAWSINNDYRSRFRIGDRS